MRIVVDVTPLSHAAHRDRQLHPRDARGPRRGAGGGHEVVAFAPVGCARRAPGAGGARAASRSSGGSSSLPPSSHTWRTAWSRLGAGGGAARRRARRLPLLRLDVPARSAADCARRRSTTSSPLHFPEWVRPLTAGMHGRKYRHAAQTCDVIVVISSTRRTTSPSARLPARADRRRLSRRRRRASRRRGTRPMRTTVRPHARHAASRGRTYARRFGSCGRLELGSSSRRRRSVQPAWRRVRRSSGRRAAGALPRRRRRSPIRRSSRASGCPMIEAMACGTPVVASSHPSLDEACGDAAVRADPTSPEAIAAAIERALDERETLVAARASSTRGASPGGPAARLTFTDSTRWPLRHFRPCSASASTSLRSP